MKIAKLIILLCIVPLLLTGCKSIDDVKHLTKEQMQRYVQKRIGEEVKLISATGDENGNGHMLYVFNIVDRDIDFDVVAFKTSSGIDGMTIGNYWLEIWIKYLEGVTRHYQEESAKLANKHDVYYKLHKSVMGEVTASSETTVYSFDDIDRVTDFFVELDQLYAFSITSKYKSKDDLGLNYLHFSSSNCGFFGIDFSSNSRTRLKREKLKEKIIKEYVHTLHIMGRSDSHIPQEVWDKYKR